MEKATKIVLIIFAGIFVLLLIGRLINIANHSTNQNNNPNNQNPSENFILNIRYGPAPLQIFDFYPPAGNENSNTLIVFVHGGAWVAGDKNYFSQSAQFFADRGYSVVNMNYRLAPTWTYPSQLYDITSVLNYINANPEGFKLNSGHKIVLVGHSAGGQLVDLYGVEEQKFGGTNVDKVVSLAGPTDLVSYYEHENKVDGFLDAFLNGTSKEEASPSRNVQSGDSTKFFLIIGKNDELVPQNQVTIFENALQEKGVYVETLFVDGRSHNTIYNKIPSDDIVAEKILGFIQ